MARTHGIAATYQFGCRCDDCRAAWTCQLAKTRRSRAERLATDPTLAPHGSHSTYINWGCRCGPCVRANTEKCRAYAARQRERMAS